VAACFAGLWIQSVEHDEAIAEIAGMCRDENWRVAVWDAERGVHIPGSTQATEAGGSDPLAAIRAINALTSPDSFAILILVNFHRYLQSAEVVQALANQIIRGKQSRAIIVVLAPVVQIPPELEKLFCLVEHALPDRVQLEQIARQTATQPGELTDEILPRILDAAAGMTRYEAENAFSLCLVRQRPEDSPLEWRPYLDPEVIFDLKAQAIAKSGLAKMYKGTESFADIGGLAQIKHHLSLCAGVTGDLQPKGIVLVGQPGTGKSHIAKAAGRILARPVITASLSRLKGRYVGDTGENTRRLLALIRAIGRCAVVLDEGNQQLGGGAERHETTEELIGELLTFLNDQQDAFFILTANEIASLPDAFTRAGRFDGVYFVDLPSTEQREAIWSICLQKYGIDPKQTRPACEGWTGAEIDHCCRTSRMFAMSLSEAARFVVPICVRQAEKIEARRKWANGACLDAERPGLFAWPSGANHFPKPGRRVRRDPSNN
jgi:hypothetical protein